MVFENVVENILNKRGKYWGTKYNKRSVQNDLSLLYFQLFLIHQSLLQCLVINNAWDKDLTSHPADLVWTCLSQLYNYPFNWDFGMTIMLQLGRNFHFPDSLKVIMCAANFYFLLLTF